MRSFSWCLNKEKVALTLSFTPKPLSNHIVSFHTLPSEEVCILAHHPIDSDEWLNGLLSEETNLAVDRHKDTLFAIMDAFSSSGDLWKYVDQSRWKSCLFPVFVRMHVVLFVSLVFSLNLVSESVDYMDKARSFHNKDPICCWVSEIGNSQTNPKMSCGVIVGGASKKARGGL